MFDGTVPDKSPAAAPTYESYIGSINSPLIDKSIDSVGDITKSNSYPSLDCDPAFARTKPVPTKVLVWKSSISWSNIAIFKYPDGSKIFAPSSNTSAFSGLAYLVPTVVLAPTGVPAAANAAISVAVGLESLEIFQAEALKPVEIPP